MENQKYSSEKSASLQEIIAAYADIWADILLEKNLDRQLLKITEDIAYLNKLIDLKEHNHTTSLSFYRVVNQLYRLKDIVLNKQKRLSQAPDK